MHHSKLKQILIDCNAATLTDALPFWSGALGLELDARDGPGDRYFNLIGTLSDVQVLVQRVDDASAYHLDIEATDVEAEVRRLEALGATRKRKVHTWWVMRSPTGHDFCVIRPQSGDLERTGRRWP